MRINEYLYFFLPATFLIASCAIAKPSQWASRSHAEMLCLSNGIEKGPIRFSGAANKKNIEDVVGHALGELTSCYQNEVSDQGLESGEFTLQWILNTCGRVSSPVVVSNTYSSKRVDRCLVKVLRGLKFEKPSGRGNVMVTYPISFEIQR